MAKQEVPSVRELHDAFIADYEARTGQKTPLLKSAFVRILAWAFSGLTVLLYRQGQWVYLQMFVDTCEFGALQKYGARVGIVYKDGSSTEAEVTLAGVSAGGVPTGTVFLDQNGKTYRTLSATSVVSGTAVCAVTAFESGTGFDLGVGDVVTLGSALVGVPDSGTVTAVNVEGENPETEEEYRARVQARYRLSPQGGAPADYFLWGTGVDGIVDIFVYLIQPGTVDIYAVETGSGAERAPSTVKLAEVEDAMRQSPDSAVYDRHPVQSILNVRAPSFITYDIDITGLDASANTNQNRADIKSALISYLDSRRPEIPSLNYSVSEAIVSEAEMAARVSDTLNASNNPGVFDTVDVSIGGTPVVNRDLLWVGELANLGALTINGVSVV